jgi:hypothetical protein
MRQRIGVKERGREVEDEIGLSKRKGGVWRKGIGLEEGGWKGLGRKR